MRTHWVWLLVAAAVGWFANDYFTPDESDA